MATRDEMMQALRAADAAGATDDARRLAHMIAATPDAQPDDNYSNEGRSRPESPYASMGTAERTWEGVKGGAARLRDELLPPGNPLKVFSQDQSESAGRDRKARLAYYEQNKDDLGTAGAIGDVLPEVALSAAPIARAGTVIGRAPMLAKALGRYAPAIGDIVANAGYEATKAGYNGGDVGTAALAGGGGATAGRVLTRALGGLKPLMSKEAQALVKEGVYPTPGQMFDGPVGSLARSIEDKATSIPLVGDVINYARTRSLGDYGRAEIKNALEPVGGKVTGSGAEAVDRAQQQVSKVYDSALDGMNVTPRAIENTVGKTKFEIQGIPLLDDRQAAQLAGYLNMRVAPLIEQGAPINGQMAKALDAEMGHYARKYSRSVDPAHHPLGEAFYTAQANWREAMAAGSSPDKTALLEAANAAHRNLLPIVKAADKAAAQGGKFTPGQLQRSYGPYRQEQSALNEAGQAVLPSRVPDSGSAGRLLFGSSALGGAAFAGGVGPVAAGGGLTAILYSRPGLALMTNGLAGHLQPHIRDWLLKLPPDRQREFILRYAKEVPSVNQLAAQVGRQLATQGEPQQ